jgi:hypothetical protein
MGLRARVRRTVHNYRRLFAKPHLKATLITLAAVDAIFIILAVIQRAEAMEGLAAGFVYGLIILWLRQKWITDDYDRAEAAAAEAERVRQDAQREREAKRIPPPPAFVAFRILGLNENATDAEIKTAFRRLVKRYHPDRNRYSREANAEKFRQVQEAYADLRKRRAF